MKEQPKGFEWRKTKEKIVINKNGVYVSLTLTEFDLLKITISDIDSGTNKLYQEDNR